MVAITKPESTAGTVQSSPSANLPAHRIIQPNPSLDAKKEEIRRLIAERQKKGQETSGSPDEASRTQAQENQEEITGTASTDDDESDTSSDESEWTYEAAQRDATLQNDVIKDDVMETILTRARTELDKLKEKHRTPVTDEERAWRLDLSMESGDLEDSDRVPRFEDVESIRASARDSKVKGIAGGENAERERERPCIWAGAAIDKATGIGKGEGVGPSKEQGKRGVKRKSWKVEAETEDEGKEEASETGDAKEQGKRGMKRKSWKVEAETEDEGKEEEASETGDAKSRYIQSEHADREENGLLGVEEPWGGNMEDIQRVVFGEQSAHADAMAQQFEVMRDFPPAPGSSWAQTFGPIKQTVRSTTVHHESNTSEPPTSYPESEVSDEPRGKRKNRSARSSTEKTAMKRDIKPSKSENRETPKKAKTIPMLRLCPQPLRMPPLPRVYGDDSDDGEFLA